MLPSYIFAKLKWLFKEYNLDKPMSILLKQTITNDKIDSSEGKSFRVHCASCLIHQKEFVCIINTLFFLASFENM